MRVIFMISTRSEYSDGRLIIFISGELDHHAAREAAAKIDDILEEYLPRDCVLDLGGLKFMDSSGIALILRVSKRLAPTGGRTSIENPAPQALRVIDASGIDRLIPVAAAKRE